MRKRSRDSEQAGNEAKNNQVVAVYPKARAAVRAADCGEHKCRIRRGGPQLKKQAERTSYSLTASMDIAQLMPMPEPLFCLLVCPLMSANGTTCSVASTILSSHRYVVAGPWKHSRFR